jgi:hypothetical protein
MNQKVAAYRYTGPRLPSVTLLGPTGGENSLQSLVSGHPTVLMIWDRRISASADEVAQVARATELLAEREAEFVWVTPEPDSKGLQTFLRVTQLGLAPYHDLRSALIKGLGEVESRSFYVIDRAGRVSARTHSLMEAVRHIEVLEIGSRGTA